MVREKEILQHPLAVVDAFSRYILLLLLPLLRSFMLFWSDFSTWISGVWLDVLVLLVILGFGVARWWSVRVRLGEGLIVRSGLLIVRRRVIPLRKLSSIAVERVWYLRPFKAVRFRAETDAGLEGAPELRLLLRDRDAEAVEKAFSDLLTGEKGMVRRYEPRGRYVGILSFLTSDSLTGVLFAAAVISQSGKILGEEAEDRLLNSLTRLMQMVAFWLPPAAALIAGVILGGWLIDFTLNLIRHLRFQAVRQGDEIFVRCGAVTVRRYTLSARHINYLYLRQSLFTAVFGFYSGSAGVTGYGKNKGEQAVILPAVGREDLRRSLSLILPELRPCGKKMRPPLRTLWRMVWPPLLTAAVAGILWRAAYRRLPAVEELTMFLGAMVMLPAVWWLLIRFYGFFHTGVGWQGDAFTFRATRGYRIFTVVVPADKIVRVQVVRNIFQRQSRCADLKVFVRAEGRRCFLIRNLDMDDVQRFLEALERRSKAAD